MSARPAEFETGLKLWYTIVSFFLSSHESIEWVKYKICCEQLGYSRFNTCDAGAGASRSTPGSRLVYPRWAWTGLRIPFRSRCRSPYASRVGLCRSVFDHSSLSLLLCRYTL